MQKQIKTVTTVGMGALGLLFGAQIQKYVGAENFCFLMDEERKKKYQGQIFYENGEERTFRMVSGGENSESKESADSKPADTKFQADQFMENQFQKADLVIVAVKYTGLRSAAELLQKSGCVGEDTIIISLLNGIDSEEILAETFGMEKIVYCIAQGMDAMKFGNKLNYTKIGALHLGTTGEQKPENLDALTAFFDAAGVPYVKETDVIYRLWAKFMLNVGVNQTCMAYGTTYSGVLNPGEPHDTFVAAMEETVRVANAEGVALGQQDVETYIRIIGTLSPDGTPSMGQDRINRKPSEVDMFAGKILQLAAKHGIPVPANERLYAMVKEIEREYVGKK